jgi:hypothetical protein
MNQNFHITTTALYSVFSNYVPNSPGNIITLSDSKHAALIREITTAINSGSPIHISLFSDAEGTVSTINNKAVNIINYRYPYVSTSGDVTTENEGALTFIFSDNTMLQLFDSSSGPHWFSLNGSALQELV